MPGAIVHVGAAIICPHGGQVTILDAPSHLHLAYRPGVPLVHTVLRNGEFTCTP